MRLLLLLLLASSAAAQQELLREEAYNYRVVGALGPAWKRQGARLHFTYSVDAIPHAHVQLARQRVRGKHDLEKELRRRAARYRFPDTPKGVEGAIRKTRWAGHDAWLYELKCTVRGVACTRRVTLLLSSGVFYELIETLYGDKTDEREDCRRGLEVFRTGFALLVDPLPGGAESDKARRTLRDPRYGYSIVKPEGFLRRRVNPAADPGIREHFERVAGNGKQHARVRLFEYAERGSLVPERWFDIFYSAFQANNAGASRSPETPPAVEGARAVFVQRFEGKREGLPIRTRVVIVHARNGHVFVLRIRTQDKADSMFKKGLDEALGSLRFAG